MRARKAFAVEKRAISSSRIRLEKRSAMIAIGVISMSENDFRISALADDVARLLTGRTSFPREMWSDAR